MFRYYRDLINFKDKGDPALMLKCINPIESKLLDAAAGVHLKFRLAGVSIWGEGSYVFFRGGCLGWISGVGV